MKKMIILGAVAVLVLSACASPGGGELENALPSLPPAADDGGSLVPGGELPPGVQFATSDLAAHLGVSVDVIDWVSYEEVTWPDGSLGCPQPGMSYTAALVPGSLILFEVDGVEYAYHGGGVVDPFLCIPAKTDS